MRRDGKWDPYPQSGHHSAQKEAGLNIWTADLSAFKLDSIPELRVNGGRITQARYPNANPETEFWPVGYLTSAKADWLAPKISPKPNPARTVSVPARGDYDDYFSDYGGGIGGTCSIYVPAFSYWCQDTFSKGCGGCFTWNVPSGLKVGTKLAGKNYSNWEDAYLFAWRAAHWANWMFEIDRWVALSGWWCVVCCLCVERCGERVWRSGVW
jgi:hypothetical protein